jgi:hypothetical protein
MIFADFLYGDFIDENLCDSLIDYYENCNEKKPGKVGASGEINTQIKESTDISISPKINNHVIQTYCYELDKICKKYSSIYEYCTINQSKWNLIEDFNIQKYLPNQGFKLWHYEKTGNIDWALKRHLVFMTYLNDVTDEGGTEWLYQKVTITPKKGLTVIWPAEWTFTHRGVISKTQTKYITTGWYSYE